MEIACCFSQISMEKNQENREKLVQKDYKRNLHQKKHHLYLKYSKADAVNHPFWSVELSR